MRASGHRVRTSSGEVEIEVHPASAIDDATREASLRELRRLVQDFKFREPRARGALLEIFARLHTLPPGTARGHAFDFDAGSPRADALGRELLDAARAGHLLLRRTERRSVVMPLQDEEEPALGPEAEPTGWIEIELVDEEGNPVPNVVYRIECDDGRERTGTTNGWGKAREEGLHDGNCKVSFPRLDALDWKKAG